MLYTCFIFLILKQPFEVGVISFAFYKWIKLMFRKLKITCPRAQNLRVIKLGFQPQQPEFTEASIC